MLAKRSRKASYEQPERSGVTIETGVKDSKQ